MDYQRSKWSHVLGHTEEYRNNWEQTFGGQKEEVEVIIPTPAFNGTVSLAEAHGEAEGQEFRRQVLEELTVSDPFSFTINPDVAWGDEEPGHLTIHEALCAKCECVIWSCSEFKPGEQATCPECE